MNSLFSIKKLSLCLIFIILMLISTAFIFININNKANPIDIVFITDDNYVLQTRAAIKSIVKNKNYLTKTQINVLGFNLTDKNIKKIEKEKRRNAKINVIKVSDDDINKLNFTSTTSTHVTRADYLKFFLPTIFKNKDKILYIDADTIILKDLSQLFNTNIDDYYIAAVDEWNIEETKKSKNPAYFNNGVMLLNLKNMRKDNIEKKLIDCKLKDRTNEYVTQDTFNKVIDKVKYIHLKYNVFALVYDIYDDKGAFLELLNSTLNGHYDSLLYMYDNINELRKDTVIIHYASAKKPCHEMNFKRKSYKIWYRYAPSDYWIGRLKQSIKKSV